MRKVILLPIFFILIAQLIGAGVTHPQPTELELLRGQSGRFKFQIQTIAEPYAVECTYSIEDAETSLIVEFDTPTTFVEGGTKKNVYGTVTAPIDADYGVYEESFCVQCDRIYLEKPAGTTVQIKTCDLPITVDVVPVRTRANMFIPEEPKGIKIVQIVLIAGIAAILLIIIWLLYKKQPRRAVKKKKKQGI